MKFYIVGALLTAAFELCCLGLKQNSGSKLTLQDWGVLAWGTALWPLFWVLVFWVGFKEAWKKY